MTNVPFDSIDDFRDIESINYYRYAVSQLGRSPDEVLPGMRASSRDNARTPFQWDGREHSGFTTGTPWIPVHPNHQTVNAAAQRGTAGSVFEHYRALIRLRHTEPAIVHGDFRLLLADHPAVFAYVRAYRNTRLLVLANVSSNDVSADLPEDDTCSGAAVLLSNYESPRRVAVGSTRSQVGLRPWEATVLLAE